MLHAGECALQDLPLHVLHKITSSLDPSSQRSLFLSSSQLYKKWLIQIPVQDRHWQFVQQSISVLADTTLVSSCTPHSNISIHSEAQVPWGRISCQQQQQGLQFGLAHSTKVFPDGDRQPDYRGISQAQLWHRLTAVRELAFATLTLKSSPHATPQELVTFAKRCFNLLCNGRGFLTFYMEGLEEYSGDGEPGYHALKVLHATHNKTDYWGIDGETCIVFPPKLDFDNLPVEVSFVHAEFVSQGPPDQPYLNPDDPDAHVYPNSQVVHDFAYKGNVDMEAWADMRDEFADDWFDHMGYSEEDEGFDDLDDLDDAAAAQLLGAMQG